MEKKVEVLRQQDRAFLGSRALPRLRASCRDDAPINPRTEFPEGEMNELADDLRQHGVLQLLGMHPADAQGR